MPIPGNLLTTAMAVMPHTDVDRALEVALSLDVPFWPQLPNYNYYEDMYVQASEHFPGILLDMEKRTLKFSFDRFAEELEEAMEKMALPDYLDISSDYSVVYHRFLELDLADRPAIRGQLEGPVSFGLNILDQDERPIIFNDTVRPFLLEFMAQRLNIQLAKLKDLNDNAFMFVDEPGLQFIFSALSGYDSVKAADDMAYFFSMIEHPRGVHLCGNPDWDFLLAQDLDVLSLDIYTNAEVFASYPKAIMRFLDKGGILVWGIIPTTTDVFTAENPQALEARLKTVWQHLIDKGIDRRQLLQQSMLSPATCCLINSDKTVTVENAFKTIRELSAKLREENAALLG